MLFGKRSLKGVRGVFSSEDVHRYLQAIIELEQEVKKHEIEIQKYRFQVSALTKELKSHQGSSSSQEETIRQQRNKITTLMNQVEELSEARESLATQSREQISNLEVALEALPTVDEHEAMKANLAKTTKDLKQARKELAKTESQVAQLTAENLRLKDKIKFQSA